MSRAPWSLRQRLVVGIVALLAVISVIVGAISVLSLRGFLLSQLDDQVALATARSQAALGFRPEGSPPPGIGEAQASRTLGLLVVGDAIIRPQYLDDEAQLRTLTESQQNALLALEVSERPMSVDLGSLGTYRVVHVDLTDEISLLVGLPQYTVDEAVTQLLLTIAGVTAAGLVAAAVAGTFVVRVALRPLGRIVGTARRVAELPLDKGEVAIAERVPDGDTDPRTEVGQVGAAFNHMLDHVQSALTARQASESKVRQFVADASHELRTPLASIRGYSELTRRSPHDLPADTRHALSRIESESVRMSALVDELLLLARLDSGVELRRDDVDLSTLLIDAVADAHAAGSDHEWELDLPETPITVTGDHGRLHQAVVNLLTNARVHTPAGTLVSVAAATADGHAVISVADNGPGIDPELLPTLFERFVRGDSSRSRAAGSTGLGLAIVRAVIERHGGTVGVTSSPSGTRFELHLPLAASPASAGATEPGQSR
ncbi:MULTISPECIES: HAMP domain-containing sensor histidine kinase [unclassified Diaminobutyricimonas]|uniref:sensor histidine kinase n=1 Tax=unclassified Diaminobutyricimonas TaxID=2643261 RepID=UPI0012F526AA|nr:MULTISPECIES: HAMP domain-containing sensor histidine kinase [unclassified Diaminobutyricimonas]